ncbi:polysaccharide-degrading enzyme [Prosthecobacter sp.]|jgi:hypothetical protein|uniref:polysaccharide-degrading enzyme n=1 Tax=Prosthecobacter sp. TaxID=1965333 RepID=UPI0037832326
MNRSPSSLRHHSKRLKDRNKALRGSFETNHTFSLENCHGRQKDAIDSILRIMSMTTRSLTKQSRLWIGASLLALVASAQAAVYEVGPGKAHATIRAVPWESLKAGDVVRIYWQPEPYREKWVLCCRGTAERPITVSGVAGPEGQLPVIQGQNATTRTALNYWGQERGVLKIGGANVPADTMPAHIVVENLDISGGRQPHVFTGRKGVTPYSKDAASIIVEKAEHLVLRNLTLHDSGNGLMVSAQSKHVRVERCHLHDNGNPASITEHNAYTECDGMVFEGNHFGPLRAGCVGNNLKDRSAGLVVANNWIEGGNRQLDLVDATGNPALNRSPAYGRTLVYGNVLIERDGDGNNQIVHYGGDSGKVGGYRKGVLHFYQNTVISTRKSSIAVFRLSSPEETVECHNNILYVDSKGKNLSLMAKLGILKLGKNWLNTGWVKSVDDFTGDIQVSGELIEGTEPGFVGFLQQDFSLTPGSPCLEKASPLPDQQLPVLNASYVPHQRVEVLTAGPSKNLGAL